MLGEREGTFCKGAREERSSEDPYVKTTEGLSISLGAGLSSLDHRVFARPSASEFGLVDRRLKSLRIAVIRGMSGRYGTTDDTGLRCRISPTEKALFHYPEAVLHKLAVFRGD